MNEDAHRDTARANRRFWDADAADYHARHPHYLEGFHWCPEMLAESEANLLGDLAEQRVLEIGCGSAPCSSWLASARPNARLITGMDLSIGMLRRARPGVPLAQADAVTLPYLDGVFDQAFSAFGAIPFIADLGALMKELARVLRIGGHLTYSCNHPMRWVFPDDPGPAGLEATMSYFDREYIEETDGQVTYAEFQHTISGHVAALTGAGFVIERVLEPEWPESLAQTWGQWSPLRGRIFPGTIIFQARRASSCP